MHSEAIAPPTRRFVAFALLSGCGWMFDTAVTLTLATAIPVGLAQALGGGLAAAGVFCVSRYGVFRAGGSPTTGLATYLAYTAGVILAAGIALAWMSAQIHAWYPASHAVEVLIAKVVITPPILGINFLVAAALSSQPRRKSTKPDESSDGHGDSDLDLDPR